MVLIQFWKASRNSWFSTPVDASLSSRCGGGFLFVYWSEHVAILWHRVLNLLKFQDILVVGVVSWDDTHSSDKLLVLARFVVDLLSDGIKGVV